MKTHSRNFKFGRKKSVGKEFKKKRVPITFSIPRFTHSAPRVFFATKVDPFFLQLIVFFFAT